MVYKLEQEHFDIFQRHANVLIDKLGLADWTISFAFEDLVDNLAECRVNRPARKAELALSLVWGLEPTEYNLKDSAYHEVLELLLDDMEYILYVKSLDEDDRAGAIARARHAIIHRLLKILMEN